MTALIFPDLFRLLIDSIILFRPFPFLMVHKTKDAKRKMSTQKINLKCKRLSGSSHDC